MEFIFEAVLQFLGEIVLQLLFELAFDLGFHSLAETLRRPKNLLLSIIGFTLWGAAAGAISLYVFPKSHIHVEALRELNLILTPVTVGLVMTAIGQIRLKKGKDTEQLERFGYAFTFAFAMAFVRFVWAS